LSRRVGTNPLQAMQYRRAVDRIAE